MQPKPFVVAILGRPNVGKSTLFNRLIGQRKSVTSSVRGTTRDRITGSVEWNGATLVLVDTGGRELEPGAGLESAVQDQVTRAILESNLCLLICDGQTGWLPADQMMLDELRKKGKRVVIAVNKLDDRMVVPNDLFETGVADVFPVSAIHGKGTGDLLDALVGIARNQQDATHDRLPSAEFSLAIVGRQNVGKSSLLNRLMGDERAIVSELAGTTRDVVDSLISFNGKLIRVLDTAGLRHRRKVHNPVDTFSMMRARDVIKRCDVVLLLIDATLGVANDDFRIINEVCESGTGLVLAANKWDLLPKGDEKVLIKTVRRLLPQAAFAPIIAVSAKTGFQIHEALQLAERVVDNMRRGIPEETCVLALRRAWESHLPPRYRGRAIKLKKAQWSPGKPARLILKTVPIGQLPKPYQHYLLKRLYANPRFLGQPIELVIEGPPERK